MRTRAFRTLTALISLGVLAACSNSADHNAADVTFATDMIPHHRQAVQMAELATDRSDSPEVLALADEISAAQEPEIETMSGWLEEWGEPVPDDMSDMDMGEMPGMLTDEQLTELEAADGPAFDQLFLEAMVDHHTGAIQMAQTEQQDGSSQAAIDLAKQIEEAQTVEIDRMRTLLEGL